jgi:hypothetical protein
VIQDLTLETLECGAGVDPKLIDETRAGLLEGLKCVCLPSGSIEREHQLSAQSLTERVISDEALELWDDLRMPAELELRLDLLLDHRESELLEPRSLRGRELLIPKVRQRLAAEEFERGSELARTCGRAVCSRLGDDSLEAVSVQLIAIPKLQSVSRRSCLDPIGSKPLSEGRDVTVQRLLRGLRRPRAPQGPDQFVDRHDLVRPKEQEREQCTLLRPHGRDIFAVGVHLEPAEEPELHPSRV